MQDTLVDDPVIEYYVVFTQGVHWIAKLLRRNFSHIYVLTKDQYNWLLLNPTRLYLQAMIPPAPVSQFPGDMIHHNDSVIKIVFRQRNSRKQFGYVGLLNCVTWTKYMLGLRVSSLTPWRLYNRLLKFTTDDRRRHGIISIERVS